MPQAEWKEREADTAVVERLASELSLPFPLAKALVGRGCSSEADAISYLKPSLKDVTDPFSISGMEDACSRLWKAVESGEKILIYGDYDCDGLTASATLCRFLRGIGHSNLDVFIPSRLDDGYGLSCECIERCLKDYEPGLVVTVDCGVNSHEEVALIQSRGVDVIVTDHHEPGTHVASAAVLVNPKIDSPAAMADLAGVGVAFMLAYGTVKLSGMHRKENGYDIRDLLGLVALGTVADIVPLSRENRILVKAGIERFNSSPSVGIAQLMKVAGVGPHECEAYHLGYLLGPRINAAGRLGRAEVALRLLLSDDPGEAADLAKELDAANRERKRIEDAMLKEALAMIDEKSLPMGIVVGKDGWHPGTLGIVASRLTSRFSRPAVVVSFDESGGGKGSCRSVEGVDLAELLNECDELLTSHGGHAMAAGVGVRKENFEEFRAAFASKCNACCEGDEFPRIIDFDGWVSGGDLSIEFCNELSRMQPAGRGNPPPVWGVKDASYSSVKVFKDRHLSFTLNSGGAKLKVIGFSMAGRRDELPDGEIDLLFEAKPNTFRGVTTVDLVLADFRSSMHGTFESH